MANDPLRERYGQGRKVKCRCDLEEDVGKLAAGVRGAPWLKRGRPSAEYRGHCLTDDRTDHTGDTRAQTRPDRVGSGE